MTGHYCRACRHHVNKLDRYIILTEFKEGELLMNSYYHKSCCDSDKIKNFVKPEKKRQEVVVLQ